MFCEAEASKKCRSNPDAGARGKPLSELGCCENISNCDKSMKLGRMVHIDLTNKFSLVGRMNYGYEGHRSRSK